MKSSSTVSSGSATSASVWSSASTSSNRVSSSIVLIATHARCDFVPLLRRLVSRPFQQLRSSSPHSAAESPVAHSTPTFRRRCRVRALRLPAKCRQRSFAQRCGTFHANSRPEKSTVSSDALQRTMRHSRGCAFIHCARGSQKKRRRRLCNAAARTVAHKCQRPQKPTTQQF